MKPQEFNDGMALLYKMETESTDGNMPAEKPTGKVLQLRFEERAVGIRRQEFVYMQTQKEVSRVIRTPLQRDVTTDYTAQIGEQLYQINLIQYPPGTLPPVMDLTLTEKEEPEERTNV